MRGATHRCCCCCTQRGEVPLGLDDWQVEEPSFARASLELSSSSAGGGGGSRDATLNGSTGAMEHTLLDVVEEAAAERRPAPWQPQRRVTEEEEGIRRAQQRSGELSLRTSPAAKRPQRYIIDEVTTDLLHLSYIPSPPRASGSAINYGLVELRGRRGLGGIAFRVVPCARFSDLTV